MAEFIITSQETGLSFKIDNREAIYKGGELIPYLNNDSSTLVFIYDKRQIFSPDRLTINLSVDTVNVNGVTSFADASDLYANLKSALITGDEAVVWHKFGFNDDIDTAEPELIASYGGAFDPLTMVQTTNQTYTINYDNSLDGSTSTGAMTLLFSLVRDDGGVLVEATEIHVLGSAGTDVTSFSGQGINRVSVISDGGNGSNGGIITITNGGVTYAEIPLNSDGVGTSVTQQLLFHTPQGYNFKIQGLEVNCLKLSGGSAPTVVFTLYSFSRVTNISYQIFSRRIDTSIENDAFLMFGGYPIITGGREVIYAVASTSTNNTAINGRIIAELIKS